VHLVQERKLLLLLKCNVLLLVLPIHG